MEVAPRRWHCLHCLYNVYTIHIAYNQFTAYTVETAFEQKVYYAKRDKTCTTATGVVLFIVGEYTFWRKKTYQWSQLVR